MQVHSHHGDVTAAQRRANGTGLMADSRNREWWRLLVIVAGAGVISLGAQVSTPSGGDVPGTMQPLAVLLVGLLLGPWRGTAAAALYVVLGIIGAPVFAGGGSGYGGPTSGYFIGFIIAALLAGLVSQRACGLSPARAMPRLLGAAALGLVAIYALGLGWLIVRVGLSLPDALAAGFTPFIVADLLEGVVAAGLTALLAAFWRPKTA